MSVRRIGARVVATLASLGRTRSVVAAGVLAAVLSGCASPRRPADLAAVAGAIQEEAGTARAVLPNAGGWDRTVGDDWSWTGGWLLEVPDEASGLDHQLQVVRDVEERLRAVAPIVARSHQDGYADAWLSALAPSADTHVESSPTQLTVSEALPPEEARRQLEQAPPFTRVLHRTIYWGRDAREGAVTLILQPSDDDRRLHCFATCQRRAP